MYKLRPSLNEMLNSEFYRNIAGLFTGIAAARIVPAIFALVIARIYSPADFGWFVLMLTISSVLSIPATGGFEKALLLTNSDAEKKHLVRFSMRLNRLFNFTALAAILLFLVIIRPDSIQSQFTLLMIPVYAYFFASVQLMRNQMISLKEFKRLSKLEIFRALAVGGFQSLFFIIPEMGLFLGVVLAQVATYLLFLPKNEQSYPVSKKREKVLARRFVNFPKFSVASELMNFVSSQLPIFLIKPFFGATSLGLYGFAHRYLSLPVQLTTVSIGSVYVQKAQTLLNEREALRELTDSLFRKQFLLAIVPFSIMGLWGEKIFQILLGSEWAYAGYLGALITPWLFMVYIGAPLATILIVMEKQKVSMYFNFTMLLLRAAVLLAGGLILKDLSHTIILYSMVGFISFLLLTCYSLYLARVSLLQTGWFAFKNFILVATLLLLLKLWL